MNFLVDAQLPRRFAQWLAGVGNDAMHTLDLPEGNRTSDSSLIEVAEHENRVLVTKDADFVDSHLIRGLPSKLLLVSTGNISNSELQILIEPLIPVIVIEFASASMLEVGRVGVIVRT